VLALVFAPELANKRKIMITPASRTLIGLVMFCRNIAQLLLDRRPCGRSRRRSFLVDYTTTIKAPPIEEVKEVFTIKII
jgi:hypothetical protein